jgi:hypothetical protein
MSMSMLIRFGVLRIMYCNAIPSWLAGSGSGSCRQSRGRNDSQAQAQAQARGRKLSERERERERPIEFERVQADTAADEEVEEQEGQRQNLTPRASIGRQYSIGKVQSGLEEIPAAPQSNNGVIQAA